MKVTLKLEGSKYTAAQKDAITWSEAVELMRACLIATFPYLKTQDIIDALSENVWEDVNTKPETNEEETDEESV